jgi:hypothetical protein
MGPHLLHSAHDTMDRAGRVDSVDDSLYGVGRMLRLRCVGKGDRWVTRARLYQRGLQRGVVLVAAILLTSITAHRFGMVELL